LDYIVLAGYFLLMMGIGWWAMRRVKAQEDYLMGGRKFGKWLQAFAAFGAGTGSSDPVNTARTSFTSGMSGMWSVMSWLFVTPVYWFAGVWYRRMRHLTLGDWFVERYQSRKIGAAYAVFGLLFYMVYTSMLFSAIGKVAAPLIGNAVVIGDRAFPMEYILVPLIAIIVMVYGILGGLTAAYWTDVLQGAFIIFLSIILIPFGLDALVEKFGDPQTQGLLSGFRIIHEQLPENLFTIVGSSAGSEFPLHRIAAVTFISLVGIVVNPHFIATGGGSAKNELNARVGLVAGNLAKRFCTIGWALTALIVLALFADNTELVRDPDKAWGIASRELLWPGLRGLMLACMLAALMSSADTYMLVTSGLMVRNLYVPYVSPDAGESECLRVARLAGLIMIIGAVLISWFMMDVFQQLQLTWIVPMVFAAPFWVGMFWRRATTHGAWAVILFTLVFFFILPWMLPVAFPGLKNSAMFSRTTNVIVVTTERAAAPSDVRFRNSQIRNWESDMAAAAASGDADAVNALGPKPDAIEVGDALSTTVRRGGQSIYWSKGVTPDEGTTLKVIESRQEGNSITEVMEYDGPVTGQGNLQLEFLLYDLLGFNMRSSSAATLATMELVPKILIPFMIMILVSLFTRRNDSAALDRLYIKMRTPVAGDAAEDSAVLEKAYADPESLDRNKLLPGTDWEFARARPIDWIGFAVTIFLCFSVIWIAIWVAGIGAS
jgi:SSS family solute:Na+ symporter